MRRVLSLGVLGLGIAACGGSSEQSGREMAAAAGEDVTEEDESDEVMGESASDEDVDGDVEESELQDSDVSVEDELSDERDEEADEGEADSSAEDEPSVSEVDESGMGEMPEPDVVEGDEPLVPEPSSEDPVSAPTLPRLPAAGSASVTVELVGPSGFCDAVTPTVVHVDCALTEGGDGSSWESAFASVAEGVNAASECDEVWIAEGTCVTQEANAPVAFVDKPLKIYGGFARGETSPGDRPSDTVTRLDGDFAQDDGEAPTTRADNSRHVVWIQGEVSVTLDDLQITGGYARVEATGTLQELYGGGVFVEQAELDAKGLHLFGNHAVHGGAIAVVGEASYAFIDDSLMTANTAALDGGAVHVLDGLIEVNGVSVWENSAPFGGGLYGEGAQGVLLGSSVRSNSAQGGGGGMRFVNADWVVQGCHITKNSGPGGGGGVAVSGGSVAVSRSVVADNTSQGQGGGLYLEQAGGELLVSESAVVGNAVPSSNGGGICAYAGSVTVDRSAIVGNQANYGAGIRSAEELVITHSELRGNRALVGGAMMIDSGSSFILNSSLSANYAEQSADVAQMGYQSSNVWAFVQLAENRSETEGPGIALFGDAVFELSSSLVYAADLDTSLIDASGGGVSSTAGNCALEPALPSAEDMTWLEGNPLTGNAALGDHPQAADSPCVDSGDADVASTLGLDWQALSVHGSTELDTDNVDSGYHYEENEVRIESFVADSMSAEWTTHNAVDCELGGGTQGTLQPIPEELLARGSQPHGASGNGAYLVCWGETGRPKAAWAALN